MKIKYLYGLSYSFLWKNLYLSYVFSGILTTIWEFHWLLIGLFLLMISNWKLGWNLLLLFHFILWSLVVIMTHEIYRMCPWVKNKLLWEMKRKEIVLFVHWSSLHSILVTKRILILSFLIKSSRSEIQWTNSCLFLFLFIIFLQFQLMFNIIQTLLIRKCLKIA